MTCNAAYPACHRRCWRGVSRIWSSPGIIHRRRGGGGSYEYHLTAAGRELFPVVEKMGLWAQRWLRHDLVDTADLDSDLLMWDIRRNVLAKSPPRDSRYVVEFRLSGVPISRRGYWLVFRARRCRPMLSQSRLRSRPFCRSQSARAYPGLARPHPDQASHSRRPTPP